MNEWLNQVSPVLQELIVRLLLLAGALLLIWVVQRLIRRMVFAPIEAWVEKSGSEYIKSVYSAIHRPIRIVTLAIAITVGIALLNFDPSIQRLAATLTRALVFAAVTLIIYNAVSIVSLNDKILERLTGIDLEPRLLPFIRTVVQVFIILMGALIVLQEFGVDVTGLIASLGVVGLAFSLAAKDSAANIFGFTAIVGDNLFEVGDYIVAGDIAGTVEHVGVRSSRLRKLDQSIISVPNSKLADASVENWTRLHKRRVDFGLRIKRIEHSAQMRALITRLRAYLQNRGYVERDSVNVFFSNLITNDTGDTLCEVRINFYIKLRDFNAFSLEREQINLGLLDILNAYQNDPDGFSTQPLPTVAPPTRSDVPSQATQ